MSQINVTSNIMKWLLTTSRHNENRASPDEHMSLLIKAVAGVLPASHD